MQEEPDYRQLNETLQQLEERLREVQWWSSTAPEPGALASSLPFCADTMAFEHWLQWVFIPRMRSLMDEGHPLPGRSGLAPMGEMAWQEQPREALLLLPLLRRIDRMLNNG